ncbi:MAG: hypothetical protein EOO12_09005 [Chitinophagaceae bacterium]|nr:MAG: hypothetical protein EOO12_09005 [Chitinophagaceae bacterium]
MKSFLLLALSALSLGAAAQTDSSARTDSTKPKPQFKLSVNYLSSLHYYGRTDSVPGSGFFPMAELPTLNSAAPPTLALPRASTTSCGSAAARTSFSSIRR